MPNIQFSDPQTGEKFESTVEADRMVHKPQVYSGLLSNITPQMAAAMVADGCNLVKEKTTAKAVAAAKESK